MTKYKHFYEWSNAKTKEVFGKVIGKSIWFGVMSREVTDSVDYFKICAYPCLLKFTKYAFKMKNMRLFYSHISGENIKEFDLIFDI